MADFVPKVTYADVERVVRRDYPDEVVDRVMSLLDQYGHEKWHLEEPRVLLACLKLANGDLRELQRQISVASSDFRDVLAAAEYPGVCAIGFVGMKKLKETNPSRLDELQQRDWDQYREWLNRMNSPTS
jgi:hypothetical protein